LRGGGHGGQPFLISATIMASDSRLRPYAVNRGPARGGVRL